MCSPLTSIDSAGDLLWALLWKGLATLRADWMFNLLASKLRSEHIPHNGTHSSRWPLLSPRRLSGRRTDKEILCMCVPWLCRRKRYRKETKVLIWTSLRSHWPSHPPLSLSLIYLSLSQITGFSFLTPKERNTSIKLCVFVGACVLCFTVISVLSSFTQGDSRRTLGQAFIPSLCVLCFHIIRRYYALFKCTGSSAGELRLSQRLAAW